MTDLDRKIFYYGHVNHIQKCGWKTLTLNERPAIYVSNYGADGNFLDVYYDSPKYEIILNKNIVKLFNKAGINFVMDCTRLDYLLKYFGFGEKLDYKALVDLRNTLFNGKFAYENFSEFGYQKKRDLVWKNGMLVSNPKIDIEKEYTMQNYELVDYGNKLAEYFPLLNEIDYKDPEASFAPLEAEGPVRKRILLGSDENE